MAEIIVKLPDEAYEDIKATYSGADVLYCAVKFGTPLPKGHDIDALLQKATDEVFVQCKQFNERFSKDWNEGFNDGMFHTLTIIKEIIKADKEVSDG